MEKKSTAKYDVYVFPHADKTEHHDEADGKTYPLVSIVFTDKAGQFLGYKVNLRSNKVDQVIAVGV